tara:strand:+ start:892 stop:1386 length:495 start_codon:yes stop_codon:yes gene_type:complete
MNYKIVDNYLPKDELDRIKNIVLDNNLFNWYYTKNITHTNANFFNYFYLIHNLYDNNLPNSPYYDELAGIFLDKGHINSLLRMKINLYPNQGSFVEHPSHTDYDFEHKAALFSLNTCDGYTKLEDGTKIDSVENRMLFFDASKSHCSTNTTNTDRRVNINFNYF